MNSINTEAAAAGLTDDEAAWAERLVGRTPNALEWALFGALWSEHCSYKSTRHLLRRLPTAGERVLVGPGENAGVVDVGDGLALVFKMESHNHPSFVEPHEGAATGVGGILRDVIALGARPIALVDALRFGDPSKAPMRRLVDGVVRGIADYGNGVGVPVVGGDTAFDSAYDRNILVNVLAIGVVARARLVRGRVDVPAGAVFLVGARTGRDGIKGARMASAAFESATEALRPTVQVGDPYFGKLLLECCVELAQSGAVAAMQDLGAAGLASAASEIAIRSRAGIALDLDAVPAREPGLTAEELLLSESQERMLVVAHPGREDDVRPIADKWELACACVGELTDSGRFEVRFGGATVADVDVESFDRAPARNLRTAPRHALVAAPPVVTDVPGQIRQLISDPSFSSKRWIYEQFDATVRAGTVLGPGRGDAAVVRLPGTDRAIGIAVGACERGCAIDPRHGARLAVMACARSLACVGAEPLAVTDCLNFGDPADPHVAWELAECIEGLAAACRALGVPVVSGNVSLHNATNGRSIPPTPMIGMVGLLDDARVACGRAFRPGARVLLLGRTNAGQALDDVHELALQATVRELVQSGAISAAHQVAEGGLAVALVEGCLAGEVGLDASQVPEMTPEFLFDEAPSRVVIACAPEAVEQVHEAASRRGVPVTALGTAGGERLVLRPDVAIALGELQEAYESTLPRLMGNPVPGAAESG